MQQHKHQSGLSELPNRDKRAQSWATFTLPISSLRRWNPPQVHLAEIEQRHDGGSRQLTTSPSSAAREAEDGPVEWSGDNQIFAILLGFPELRLGLLRGRGGVRDFRPLLIDLAANSGGLEATDTRVREVGLIAVAPSAPAWAASSGDRAAATAATCCAAVDDACVAWRSEAAPVFASFL